MELDDRRPEAFSGVAAIPLEEIESYGRTVWMLDDLARFTRTMMALDSAHRKWLREKQAANDKDQPPKRPG